ADLEVRLPGDGAAVDLRLPVDGLVAVLLDLHAVVGIVLVRLDLLGAVGELGLGVLDRVLALGADLFALVADLLVGDGDLLLRRLLALVDGRRGKGGLGRRLGVEAVRGARRRRGRRRWGRLGLWRGRRRRARRGLTGGRVRSLRGDSVEHAGCPPVPGVRTGTRCVSGRHFLRIVEAGRQRLRADSANAAARRSRRVRTTQCTFNIGARRAFWRKELLSLSGKRRALPLGDGRVLHHQVQRRGLRRGLHQARGQRLVAGELGAERLLRQAGDLRQLVHPAAEVRLDALLARDGGERQVGADAAVHL